MNFDRNLFFKHSLHNTSKSSNHFPIILTTEDLDLDLKSKIDYPSKKIEYKEKLFKVIMFSPRRKAKSIDQVNFQAENLKLETKNCLIKKKYGDSSKIPKPNKINLLFLQTLKQKIDFASLVKSQKDESLFRSLQKEKILAALNFSKEKENLRNLLKFENKRSSIEESDFFFEKLQKVNKKFQTVHFNSKEGISQDPNKFMNYMEFQNSIKDKDYLLNRNKKEIDAQFAKFYQEYHKSKGRNKFEWSLA